jgi:DNA-binding NarL/FixJ family response regulator
MSPEYRANSSAWKVAILENDRFAKEGIIAELEIEGNIVVGEASDHSAIVAIIEEFEPDVVIIDLKLGREDRDFKGLEAIKRIKEISSDVKCIVVTSFPSVPNFRDALRFGAEGFVAKENSVQNGVTMGEIIKRVMNGENYYDANLIRQVVLSEGDVPLLSKKPLLTEREQQVLRMAAQYTNKQIAEALSIEESTVKAHLKNSFEKLSIDTGRKIDKRQDAVDSARALGYI